MADIHVLPVSGVNNVGYLTRLLANAFAEGVDLGPRGLHIQAAAFTLEKQLAELRQIASDFRNSPIEMILDLDQLEFQLSQLNENVSRMTAWALSLDP